MNYNYQLQQQRLKIKGRNSYLHPRTSIKIKLAMMKTLFLAGQREQVETVLEMYKDRQKDLADC